MSAPRGITITNYLTTGDPEGVIFAYMSNWTGQAIKIPRNLFAEVKSLSELARPGVYFLLGTNENNPDDKLVYVGEANNLSERISQHLTDAEKTFAETIVCFSSKDENLTVSHTKYLEQQVIKQISKTVEYRLVNKKEGTKVSLPKMSQDEMDTYLDNIKVILPTLGYSLLHNSPAKQDTRNIELLKLQVGKIKAVAQLTSNGIEVQKGSEMSPSETESISGSYSNLRKTLQDKGIVEKKGNKLVFINNYEFSSASAAGAIILGYSVNGRVFWKNKLGKTLKELEEERIKG